MPKNARMIPQESDSTGLCNKPKRTAATAAAPVNQVSVAFLPNRSTAKAAAYLPGMEAMTMTAVSRKGVEDEEDARESNPHHHRAFEVGALKDLGVTGSLPGASVRASVKIPGIT